MRLNRAASGARRSFGFWDFRKSCGFARPCEPTRSARGEGLVSHTENAEGTEENRSGKCRRVGHVCADPSDGDEVLRRPDASGWRSLRRDGGGNGRFEAFCFKAPASRLLLQGFCFKAPASRLPLRGFLLRGSLRDLRVLRVRKEPALPVRGDWVHPPEILKRLVSHEAHGERAASWRDPAPQEMPRAGPAGAPTVSPDLRDSIGRRTARKNDLRRALSTTTPPRVPCPP